jgi:hypothetical protein
MPELVAKGARALDDFLSMFDSGSDHPQILDQLKQIATYTDCLGNAHWSEPSKVIDRDLAEMLVKTAEMFLVSKETSVIEIELWRKHIGPVKSTNPGWVKKAFQNWYAEMQERGLAPQGENEAEQFIRGNLGPREKEE